MKEGLLHDMHFSLYCLYIQHLLRQWWKSTGQEHTLQAWQPPELGARYKVSATSGLQLLLYLD